MEILQLRFFPPPPVFWWDIVAMNKSRRDLSVLFGTQLHSPTIGFKSTSYPFHVRFRMSVFAVVLTVYHMHDLDI
jgi:hypothetical protein